MNNLTESMKTYLHKPIAVLCARYWYRGILAKINDDSIVLAYPRAVEVSGPATGNQPVSEDNIPSDVILTLGSIEMVAQPNWVWQGMPDSKYVKRAKARVARYLKNESRIRVLESANAGLKNQLESTRREIERLERNIHNERIIDNEVEAHNRNIGQAGPWTLPDPRY